MGFKFDPTLVSHDLVQDLKWNPALREEFARDEKTLLDRYTMRPEERRAMGYRELPSSLGVALGEMERSELVAEALGEHVFDYFLRNKRAEWEEYRSNVTPFELKQYLSL